MNEELTKEEELILDQMEQMKKWDSLIHELYLFIPCSIIVVLGTSYDSRLGVYIGLITYAVMRLWWGSHQCAMNGVPRLQR